MKKQADALVAGSWGDAAVSGLLAGIVAGVVMAAFLVAAGFAAGASVVQVLSHFSPSEGASPLAGIITHLAVSGIYGVGLALLLRGAGGVRPSLTRLAWLWGAGYGLLLWGVAAGVILTAAASPLAQIPAWEFGLAHLLFGLVAGYRLQTS